MNASSSHPKGNLHANRPWGSQLKKQVDHALRVLPRKGVHHPHTHPSSPTSPGAAPWGLAPDVPRYLEISLTVPLGSKVFVDRLVWDMRAAVDESNIYASTVAGDLGLPWVSAAVISKRLKEILDQVWKDGLATPGVVAQDPSAAPPIRSAATSWPCLVTREKFAAATQGSKPVTGGDGQEEGAGSEHTTNKETIEHMDVDN
ncbi:hypothetical protein ACKKBG_A15305 [Auxenochlorella protothecoides x Auxenochlorella symbiontica]